jgi:transcriptional regulator with XRE-family HTH domain
VQIPNLRELRELHGLTQKELADVSGVSLRSVAGYEGGAHVRPNTARKLAQALNVEVADLAGATSYPKEQALPSPEQPNFNGLLEEERRTTISNVLGSWRGMHEEGVARWSRAIERGFSSTDAAAAFCAEVIAEGAVGQAIITRHLIPQTEVLLPEDDAARERKELLETHAHLGEAMSAVIDVVEGMVDSEKDADAASKAIGRYLDQAVSRAIDETREERHDRPDLELWLRRERRRRRQAGAQATAESGEGSRKRPTA